MRRALLIALACGCGGLVPSASPNPKTISPSGAYRGTAMHVSILGDSFAARATHHLGGGDQVDATFHVRISGVELQNVVWKGATTAGELIEADVPADFPVGAGQEVVVEDPFGNTGRCGCTWSESDHSPPAIAVAASAPAPVEAGTPFKAELTLSNSGGEPAMLSQLSLNGVAAADFDAASLAAGETRVVRVERVAAAGPVAWSTALAATDPVTGGVLSASAVLSTTALAPPLLSVTAEPLPATVSAGQPIPVAVTVRNDGQIDALAVEPVLSIPASGFSPQDVPAGGSTRFQGTISAGDPGVLQISVHAAAADSFSGAAIATDDLKLPTLLVQRPAALQIAQVAIPVQIGRGERFNFAITVKNAGDATARSVSVSTSAAGTGPHATTSSAPPAVDIAGGQSATFTFAYAEDGSAAGPLSMSAAASGTEGNTNGALSATAGPLTVLVESPASLSGAWNVPASAGLATTFTALLTVTNTGGATATAVAPSTGVSGTGAIASGPVPASTTLAGGANATFTYTITATAVGNVQLVSVISGTDANTGASISASAVSPQIPVGEVSSVSTDPFNGDGTTFSYLFSYQGMIYLGPNKSGTGAVRMAPDGSGATPVNWQLEVYSASTGAARNTTYTNNGASTGVLCHTIGSPGCTLNSAQCGPDNESGHGIFISGFTGATEWYVLTGASTIGGSRYLYMTNPTFPLASGGYDDLAYEQVQAGQQGSTRMATAGHFFNGKLYVGFLDTNGGSNQPSAPVLNVLQNMPSLPGHVAASGTDLVDLNATKLPAVGGDGSPVNPYSRWLMIDAINDFNGMLYLGNNGGIVRSTNANPGMCLGNCGDWTNATPSAAAWSGKTSVVVDSAVLGALAPSQRAVPAIVPFGGKLFAARNTTTGPQLWACTPGRGGDPQQCDPGDWSLIAENQSGTSGLSQMADQNNGAITLLAATAAHLYVGYDNGGGVQIWRTANPAAAAIGDFSGRAGCLPGTSGCQGLGGNGLGSGSTRIFDGKVLDFSSQEWVYVSSGNGTGSPSVARIVP